jgi:Uma2 family endonuclease
MGTAMEESLIPERFREAGVQRPLNADDLRSFPVDRHRYEIIGGRLYVSPTPLLHHQRIVGKLLRALDDHLTETETGEVLLRPLDVHLSFYDVVQPDILVVLCNRQAILHQHGIVGAPHLVIEVISPETCVTDRVSKTALYARNGVEEYWIVDPIEETVTVYGLDGDHFAPSATLERNEDLYSIVLAGFILDLDTIFPERTAERTVE